MQLHPNEPSENEGIVGVGRVGEALTMTETKTVKKKASTRKPKKAKKEE